MANAKAYGRAFPNNATKHFYSSQNIFEEGELDEVSTCKDFLQVLKKGNRRYKSA
jgi:hypothetical protein